MRACPYAPAHPRRTRGNKHTGSGAPQPAGSDRQPVASIACVGVAGQTRPGPVAAQPHWLDGPGQALEAASCELAAERIASTQLRHDLNAAAAEVCVREHA